jgi:hypothetical protein
MKYVYNCYHEIFSFAYGFEYGCIHAFDKSSNSL